MLKCSAALLRYRTAWRELLHPLPVHARKMEWLKRDAVEQNEALLRRPYYTIKSYVLPPALGRRSEAEQRRGLHSSFSLDAAMQQPRRVTSPERLQELREQLRFPGAAGPSPPPPAAAAEGGGKAAESYEEAYGARLRPRYPESWDTVPPHQPSRGLL